MTETQDALRRFWIAVYASVTGTAMLAGCAIAFNVIDDDAGFLLVFIAGITLALGQLLNTNNKKSIFIRCGLLITLPILGMGTGILTTLLFQGDTGRGISNEGALGYLMVLAASIMYGVIAGISGLVMSFIKQKIIGKSGALPHPLASDPIFGKQARLTAALAPVLFALYFLIRGFIMQGFKSPISSSDLLSMYRLAQRQNQLTPFLGIADIAFGAAIIAGAVCLLVKALRLRRQIAGNEWSKKVRGAIGWSRRAPPPRLIRDIMCFERLKLKIIWLSGHGYQDNRMSNENSNHQTRNPKQTCPEQHRTDPNYKNSKLKVEQYDKLPEQII